MPNLPNVEKIAQQITEESASEQSLQLKRPTTLVLDCNRMETFAPGTSSKKNVIKQATCSTSDDATVQPARPTKPLFRSNSSSLHKRQSTFVPAATSAGSSKFKLSCELDQIFVISSNRPSNIDDDNYDSIEVIDERRMKNMKDRAKLHKSNTFICASSSTTPNDEHIME